MLQEVEEPQVEQVLPVQLMFWQEESSEFHMQDGSAAKHVVEEPHVEQAEPVQLTFAHVLLLLCHTHSAEPRLRHDTDPVHVAHALPVHVPTE